MSLDLGVKLLQTVEIDQLIQQSRIALREILKLQGTPSLKITGLSEGKEHPIRGNTVNTDEMYLFELQDVPELENDIVSLNVIEIKECLPYIPVDDAGFYADVCVRGLRLPIQFALAAGITLALARLCDSIIVDEITLWSPQREQSAEEFFSAVELKSEQSDILSAAKDFYAVIENRPSPWAGGPA